MLLTGDIKVDLDLYIAIENVTDLKMHKINWINTSFVFDICSALTV